METSGPGIADVVVGPLRRILVGPDRRLVLRPRPIFRYAAPLGLLALVGLGFGNGAYLTDTRGLHDSWAALLSIGAVLPVVVAVRRPLLAWRIAYPMLFLGPFHALSTESWPWPPVQIIGYLVVVLLVAFTEDPAVTAWITACGVVVPFLYTDRANAYGVAVLLVAIALFGDVLSRRRQSNRRLAEQAELTELERARRAVLEERARIAREMHDVVAHHMSMIAVQAETAPFRVTGLSEPARTEFAGIAGSARSALADMRRLLGVLRAETEQPSREPQPGLADLPDLVAAAQRAGVTVTWSLAGDGEVPEPVGLAAYRIVQEALANAARHAPGSAVEAAVLALGERLEISVRNDPPPAGPADGPAGIGHGLTGMRERAALLGGTLSAGPDPRGGYRVTATLPYREDDA
jgi:signal transduction histidine kinase